jgi:hypothetical protein
MVGSLSVPSGRFARGTVLLACYFLCKADQSRGAETQKNRLVAGVAGEEIDGVGQYRLYDCKTFSYSLG